MLEGDNCYEKKEKIEQGKRSVSLGMRKGCSFKSSDQSKPPVFLAFCCCFVVVTECCNDLVLRVSHLHKLNIACEIKAVQLKAKSDC